MNAATSLLARIVPFDVLRWAGFTDSQTASPASVFNAAATGQPLDTLTEKRSTLLAQAGFGADDIRQINKSLPWQDIQVLKPDLSASFGSVAVDALSVARATNQWVVFKFCSAAGDQLWMVSRSHSLGALVREFDRQFESP